MRIFIDFDDVIFNTKEFKNDLAAVFSSFGISRKAYEDSYFDPCDKHSVKIHNINDQIERLKEKYSFEENVLRESLNKFIQNAEKYVFKDVVSFVELHKNEELCMLSFGNKDFQERKIKSSKIQKHISSIIITDKTKAEALADALKNTNAEPIFFIDDRTEQIEDVKKKFPQIVTIFMKRPEGRYQEMVKNQYCDFEAHNFEEVENIIKSSL